MTTDVIALIDPMNCVELIVKFTKDCVHWMFQSKLLALIPVTDALAIVMD